MEQFRGVRDLPVHAVRKSILEILKETGGATVAELAEKLDMAPVSVRHHLDILQGDALIRVGRVERNGAVGRPQQFYVLTADAATLFPDNFAALAAGLVRQLKSVLPPEQVQAAFQAIAHDIAIESDLQSMAQLPLERRLERVADFLNQRGYLARWEQVPEEAGGGYLLHKYNCPYAGVSGEHRELCAMDQLLIDELVGRHCCRTRSVADSAKCCTYTVGGIGQEVGQAGGQIGNKCEGHEFLVLRQTIELAA
jgi:predicted ArsR family transcriptional regulator